MRQFNSAMEIVHASIRPGSEFRLKQSIILTLHHEALNGIHPLAGTYRNTHVEIGQSKHVPPKHADVADLVADMCVYVNNHWNDLNAIQLAAYLMWRMNWIHPFADGNGRTSRMVSYLVLSVKLKSVLPGKPTIPDQIALDKEPYYRALENADANYKAGVLSFVDMELLLEEMLSQQLRNATQEAAN